MITTANICQKNKTPYSTEFDDIYFNTENGLDESKYVFLKGANLEQNWGGLNYIIVELGFGTGLNFLNTANLAKNCKNPPKKLHFISIEAYPILPDDLEKILSKFEKLQELKNRLLKLYPPLTKGIHRIKFDDFITLDLCFGDVMEVLPELSFYANSWFLDGFSPSKNEAMWDEKIFKQIARLSVKNATLATFSANSNLAKNLEKYGFEVEKIKGYGKKRQMIKACFKGFEIKEKNPWYSITKSNTKEKTAIVIGAGIAGCSVANNLAKRGFKVKLLEKNQIASNASGNLIGAVLPVITKPDVALGEFYKRAFLYANSFYKEFAKFNEVSFDGAVVFANDEKMEQRFKLYENKNHIFLEYKKDYLNQMNAIFVKNSGFARPKKLCLRLASHKNIQIYENCEVKSFTRSNEKYQIHTKKQQFEAEILILATGSDIKNLLTNDITFKKLRGQVSHLPPFYKTNLPLSSKGYICPECENIQLIGATYKRDDECTNVREQDHLVNLNSIKSITKDIDVNLEQISGRVSFRSSTLDRFPIIGAVASDESYKKDYKGLFWLKHKDIYPNATYLPNLYISAAHGSRGLVLAPFAAEIIACMIENEPLPLEKSLLDEVHLMRFLIRKLKKGLKV